MNRIDERLTNTRFFTRLLRIPEVGAVVGVAIIFLVFSITSSDFFAPQGIARWLDRAAPLGIMSVFVALLMIGGEFDLSAGVMTGTTGLVMGLLVTQLQMNIWLGIFLSLLFALFIGFLNGLMVVKTSLPSFIVTLATFFVLRGANLGVTKLITGTVRVEGIFSTAGYPSAYQVFAFAFGEPPRDFTITIGWWVLLTLIAHWVLRRTKFGNWVMSSGGDSVAARNEGVPVQRTKILLFMGTASAAWLVGITNAIRFRTIQAGQGVGNEFMYIIAAVVGGCLLTGGFGSVIGASFGATIIGMAFIGIAFSGWNTDWLWLFVGILLFLAVMINKLVREYGQRATK